MQSHTSIGVSVKIEVDPNSVLHTSPEIFAELENKLFAHIKLIKLVKTD